MKFCENNNPNKTPWDEKHKRWATGKTGRSEFGGWSDKGLKKFQELVVVIKNARHSKEGHAVDKAILQELQEAKNWVGRSKPQKKPAKSTTTSPSKAAVVVEFGGDSDDDKSIDNFSVGF
jgi:hypothetical protein